MLTAQQGPWLWVCLLGRSFLLSWFGVHINEHMIWKLSITLGYTADSTPKAIAAQQQA